MTSQELIDTLNLLPHPEGGYYKETYRSEETTINKKGAERNVCTAIYFLLEGNDKSHFHRIQSDELWFFHLGQALEIVFILNGELKSVTLGNKILSGEVLYFKIPANIWFAAKVKNGQDYALVSCTVAPGFDFRDFELAKRDKLAGEFPELKGIIEEFTLE
jgi:predicted cupin superfamily sugar epimerase